MKQLLICSVFIIYTVLLVECTNDNNLSDKILTIDFEKSVEDNESIDLNEMALSVEYVALETNDSVIIGNAHAFVTNKYIVIVNIFNSAGIYLFNRKGQFIRQIGRKGQGPGEYSNIGGIYIDEVSEAVFVKTDSKKNIIKYGFDGVCSESIDIGKGVSFVYHDNIFFSHIPSMYFSKKKKETSQLIAYNNKGKIINQFHPVDYNRTEYLEMFMETADFSISNENLFYYLHREDTIYQVTKNKLLTYCKLNLGKYAYSKDYKWDYQGYNNSRKNNKIWIETALTTKSYIVFVLNQKGMKRLVVYDKNKNKVYNNLKNTIDYIPFNYIKTIDNNKIATVFLPSNLLSHDSKNKFPDKLRDVMENLKLDDNPVIRIITFR